MWRLATANASGKFEGGAFAWRELTAASVGGGGGWNLSAASFHERSRTPWLYDAAERRFLGYENVESIGEKARYAASKRIGGLMIWALDFDDDANSLLRAAVEAAARERKAASASNVAPFLCSPIAGEKRWWSFDDNEAGDRLHDNFLVDRL